MENKIYRLIIEGIKANAFSLIKACSCPAATGKNKMAPGYFAPACCVFGMMGANFISNFMEIS